MSLRAPLPAYRLDQAAQNAAGTINGLWWGALAGLARRFAQRSSSAPTQESPRPGEADPPPPDFMRSAWREAFQKDSRAVGAGLYPPALGTRFDPARLLRTGADLLRDAREVNARRRRGGTDEAHRAAPAGRAYPPYYRQNFHYQSGGWFTAESAERYEAQVEALFAGAAGPMRRRALALLAQAWRDRDHRGARILDLACGAGAFLRDLARSFPRAALAGVDLSEPYLRQALRKGPPAGLAQANAERLPFATNTFEAVSCVYLFHELPPRVRRTVAAEIARVLAPGGWLAFADALQPTDEPKLARPLERFPAYFHEPYFESYAGEDLTSVFGAAGLELRNSDRAFLTKALLFQKPPVASAGQAGVGTNRSA